MLLLFVFLGIFSIFWIMEVFSLEEDEFSGMFLTQSSSVVIPEIQENANKEEGSEEGMKFESEARGFASAGEEKFEGQSESLGAYSDISDPEDDFENPVYGRTNK